MPDNALLLLAGGGLLLSSVFAILQDEIRIGERVIIAMLDDVPAFAAAVLQALIGIGMIYVCFADLLGKPGMADWVSPALCGGVCSAAVLNVAGVAISRYRRR